MSTNFYVPGPALIAVGTGASKAMQFLGVTREGVRVAEEQLTQNVIADYAGSQQPADILAMGKILYLTMQVVRFDPIVMFALKARFVGSVPGAISSNEIGTLVMGENKMIPVMVKSPYQTKPAFVGYEAGINVPNAFPTGRMEWDLTTREQIYNLTFIGLPIIDFFTLSGTLWSTDMTGFPAVS
jgi:hypothetical protein